MSVLFLCMNCLRAADELNRLVHRCIILNYLEGMPRISYQDVSNIIPIIPISFILKIPPIVLYHRFNAKCKSHLKSDIVHYNTCYLVCFYENDIFLMKKVTN